MSEGRINAAKIASADGLLPSSALPPPLLFAFPPSLHSLAQPFSRLIFQRLIDSGAAESCRVCFSANLQQPEGWKTQLFGSSGASGGGLATEVSISGSPRRSSLISPVCNYWRPLEVSRRRRGPDLGFRASLGPPRQPARKTPSSPGSLLISAIIAICARVLG